MNIYYIEGDDQYRIKKRVQELAPSDFEIINYYEQEIENLPIELATSSFFSNKRAFIVRDGLGQASDSGSKKILELLKADQPDTVVIFIEKQDAKNSLTKWLSANTKKEAFNTKDKINYPEFIKNEVAALGGEISPLAVERLAGAVGKDLATLSQEARKLVLYKLEEEDKEIQSADVDELVHSNYESNIFLIIDAVASKNKRKAAALISRALDEGENEFYLLSMITGQIRNIAVCKFDDIRSEESFVKKMGTHPFVAKKTIFQARQFTKKDLVDIYTKLTWADYKMRGDKNPGQILLRLITD